MTRASRRRFDGQQHPDGMIRNIGVKGIREGNVMLEARLGPGGPVWAFTQVVVGKKAAAVSAVAARAVAVAQEELNAKVVEDDNQNTGTRIDEYEALFGMHGLAWCAMFVYWCYHSAAGAIGTANPMPRMASAHNLLIWARANDKLVDEPAAGDILIVKDGSHVGLVTGPANSSGKVPSIEGNTYTHVKNSEGATHRRRVREEPRSH